MTTFDLADVRRYTDDLDARMDQCDNGEGMECANLDGTLRHYAVLCCEFREQVRRWSSAVFAGQVAFDPEVERTFLDQGCHLLERASDLWSYGQERQGDCFELEAGAPLGSAIWRLERFLGNWVTPKLAVAPMARLGLALTPAAKEEARRRIAAIPSLPADWQPSDPRQRARLKKLRQRPTN